MSYLDQLFNLNDKAVIVTGAIGLLGTEICKGFQNVGAKVIGLDINLEGPKLDGTHYYQIDITNKSEVMATFDEIINDYGTIDVLVNNAGVSTFAPFADRTEEDLDWVIGVNLKGTFYCIQYYANLIAVRNIGHGNIINIGSIFGEVSPDFRNYTDFDNKNSEIYGATKAGVIQMTKYFAVHLARMGIRVNIVSPGGIFNPLSPQGKEFIKNYSFRCPMGRMAKTDEIIGAILYLAGDAATYTTGQNVTIDGGMTCW